MNAEECITQRRSCRRFAERSLSREVLTEIVDMARYAPSWKNSQVCRYHIVDNAELLAELADNATAGFEKNGKTIHRCSALLVLSVLHGVSGYEPDGSPSTEQGDRWEVFDAGISAQSFSLAAYAKGVGSVILGIFDAARVAELLSLPAEERVIALLALGYPEDPTPKPAPKRYAVADILRFH